MLLVEVGEQVKGDLMCAFTCDNVQDALSEMVGRRIEMVEKNVTDCYSHLLIKTYDGLSVLVDGALFTISPNIDRVEGMVASSVTKVSEAERDIVRIHVHARQLGWVLQRSCDLCGPHPGLTFQAWLPVGRYHSWWWPGLTGA